MKVFKVAPLPFERVINELGVLMGGEISHRLGVHEVLIPNDLGSGNIKGINFPNGVGLIAYSLSLHNDICIRFSGDTVHPLKLLYCAGQNIEHKFLEDGVKNEIKTCEYAIVGSTGENGHEIFLKEGSNINLVSIEIDRHKFQSLIDYDLAKVDPLYYKLMGDVNAIQKIYHAGHYNLSIAKCIDEMEGFEGRDMNRTNFLGAKSLEMLSYLLQQYRQEVENPTKNSGRPINLKVLTKAENYIKRNYHKKIAIKKIAKFAGTNSIDLQRFFKLKFGYTVNQFITDYRLNKAKKLMETSDHTIGEVAESVGFQSRSHFTLLFKNKFGLTPKKYQTSK